MAQQEPRQVLGTGAAAEPGGEVPGFVLVDLWLWRGFLALGFRVFVVWGLWCLGLLRGWGRLALGFRITARA